MGKISIKVKGQKKVNRLLKNQIKFASAEEKLIKVSKNLRNLNYKPTT